MAQPHPVKRWAATRAEQLKGGGGGKGRWQLYSQCEYKEILQLGLKSFAASWDWGDPATSFTYSCPFNWPTFCCTAAVDAAVRRVKVPKYLLMQQTRPRHRQGNMCERGRGEHKAWIGDRCSSHLKPLITLTIANIGAKWERWAPRAEQTGLLCIILGAYK